jgi:hypothetical protein
MLSCDCYSPLVSLIASISGFVSNSNVQTLESSQADDQALCKIFIIYFFFQILSRRKRMGNYYNYLIAFGASIGAVLFGYEVGVIG